MANGTPTTGAAIPKVSTAMEVKKPAMSIQDLIQQSAAQLKMALPKHMNPERIIRIALTTLRLNPKLYECNPQSFLAALFQSAQLGLEPNISGEAWMIPYNVKGQKVVQFQVGAYGLVKLYWNHQNSTSLQVEKVYTNDHFEYDLGSCELHHKPPAFGQERGEVIGYYAYATLSNGGRQLKVMSKREAAEFAKKFSKCWDANKGEFIAYTPWADHFDAMAMKTVLKQLMKLLPKSIEIQKALAMDETVKMKIEADMVNVPNEDDFGHAEVVSAESQEAKHEAVDTVSTSQVVNDASAKLRDSLLGQVRSAKVATSLAEIEKKLAAKVDGGEIVPADAKVVADAIAARQEALKL